MEGELELERLQRKALKRKKKKKPTMQDVSCGETWGRELWGTCELWGGV